MQCLLQMKCTDRKSELIALFQFRAKPLMLLTCESTIDAEFCVLGFIVFLGLLCSRNKMLNLYNCNALYIDSAKAGLPDFISLGIWNVLPIALNFSEIQLTLLLQQEYSLVLWGCRKQVRLVEQQGKDNGIVWPVPMCSPITVPGHLLCLPLPLLPVGIQNCGCLEQCPHLQALRSKVTVTQFLRWLNGKVQLGLLGSTPVWVSASAKKEHLLAHHCQSTSALEQWLWGLGQMGMVNPPACIVLREIFHKSYRIVLSRWGFSICEGKSAELCRAHFFPVNSVLCQENWPLVGWCQWLQAFPFLECCSHMDTRTHAALTAGGFAAADFFSL